MLDFWSQIKYPNYYARDQLEFKKKQVFVLYTIIR